MVDETSKSDILRALPGGADLLAWFGGVPDFGDAEILDFRLDRSGPSLLRIHVHRIIPVERDAVVTFALNGIVDLNLDGFSVQNVIGGLRIERIRKPPGFGVQWLPASEPGPQTYAVVMEPCHGLSGRIEAERVSLALAPGRPERSGALQTLR